MSKTNPDIISNLHQDAVMFREAINFTARVSGFSASLIEKDYFCTLLLAYLQRQCGSELMFKGGTSLSKVFFDFYRLSEDLDFVIPMPIDAKQKERSARAAILKKAVSVLPKELAAFYLTEELKGANSSRQYLATFGYKSSLNSQSETIKLEVGLREPLLRAPKLERAKTILQNAANSQSVIDPLEVKCLSIEEAMAEKFRAALTRREVAIRDFYDVDHASRNGMKFGDPDFIDMIRKKLAVPGNDPPNLSQERLAALRSQLEPRLKPVLRQDDYNAFDLDRAVEIVKTLHGKL